MTCDPRTRRTGRLVEVLLVAQFVVALAYTGAAAQDLPQQIVPPTQERPSAGGIFLRSLILPGWGQAAMGANTRGAVFFGIQTTSYYMLLKTLGRLSRAEGVETRMEGAAADSLRLLMAQDSAANERLSDPATFDEAVGDHEGVRAARALVTSRKRHRQDWITYTLFFTLLSGVDAYVGAHLRDFPADISGSYQAGAFRIEARIPIGRK